MTGGDKLARVLLLATFGAVCPQVGGTALGQEPSAARASEWSADRASESVAARVSGLRAARVSGLRAARVSGPGAARVPGLGFERAPGLGAPPAPDPDTATFRSDRFWYGVAGFVAADVAVMYGLHHLWYSGHERTRFHWYNDWDTYVQQDKVGHMVVAWHLARVFGDYGLWTGMSPKQAGLFGAVMSAAFQSQIEFFDGFSEAFGASGTDIAANVVGGAIGGLKVAYPHRLSWFDAKYSYHPSPYYQDDVSGTAPFRYFGNALKDYDGISYWLVVRPSEKYDVWPKWLGLSVGYSGTGLAHPLSGRFEGGGQGGPVHRRQFFVGPDLDLLALRDEWPQPLRAIASFFSFVRLPAPALQLTPELRWYWVYY